MTNNYNDQSGANADDKPINDIKNKKKNGRISGFFKLIISALIFGAIAGAAFQGYYMLNVPAQSSESSNDDKGLQATAVDDESINSNQQVSLNGIVTDVSNIVNEVMPAIVAINATASRSNYDFFGNEYRQEVQGSGSGIIIGQNSKELLIVTNNHVVENSSSIEIIFDDNTKAKAGIKGADANSDLAILSVDLTEISRDTAAAIRVATLGDSEAVEQGDLAIAIGNALGYGQSVTVGYISASNREFNLQNSKQILIQTDAAINPGNSGGALLNSEGQVVGINSIKYASTDVEGVGYAIPISKAIPMINELMVRELVSAKDQGYLGIDVSKAQNVTDIYSQRFNMPIGVYIYSIIEDSPAEKSGLKQGDIITGLDNIEIKTIDDLINALGYKKAGQEVKLRIQAMENGKYVEKILEVTLGKRK